MSGGVDSSVAAALLVDQGYRVEGLTMRVWSESPSAADQSVAAAREVCATLGIHHHTLDLSQTFYLDVVSHFVREYARGRTPNPCVRCNRLIKFGALLKYARRLGVDMLATGHYARLERGASGIRLLTGVDRSKDQSYFLYMLDQDRLGFLCFPLGGLTKTQVRALADAYGLPTATRHESQDVCFVRDGDYGAFIARRYPSALQPGPIYDARGRLLGEHRGLALYTVGQRSGLGIAARSPLYVLRLDPSRNALIVGPAEELGRATLRAENMSYVSGDIPMPGRPIDVRIRYRARRQPARVWPDGRQKATVTLSRPLRDITPGQSVVLYDGDEVLGGGIISRSVGR